MSSFERHGALSWHFRRRLGILLLAALSPLACNAYDCTPNNKPPAGSPSDFLTAPGSYGGFAIQAPKRCNDRRTILTVVGLGTNHFWTYGMTCADPAALDAGVPDACGTTLNGVLDDVSKRLQDQGVPDPWASSMASWFACDGFDLEPTPYLHLQRWQDADLAVATLGAVLSERKLGETLMAIVEPEIIACAL